MNDLDGQKYIGWKKIIFVLTAGWLVIWIYRSSFGPVFEQIGASFGGASDSQLGMISSFYFLGYVCTQIPAGILVDKVGQKKVMIPGFILFGLGTLLVALSKSLNILYVGSVLAGLGCGTYYAVAYSLTSTKVPPEKKSVTTAIVNSGTALGSGLGVISASYFIVQKGIPWQYMRFFILGLIIIMVFVFQKVIKGKTTNPAATVAKEKTITASQTAGDKTETKLFSKVMLSAYALYFVTCYSYYLIDTWLPNFLMTERGFTGIAIGFASSVVYFSSIPGALFFSRMADKFSHRKNQLIILLEILAAIMLISAVLSPNQALLVISLIGYGFFGKLAVEPLIISWISNKTGNRNIATTLGVFNFFGMSSSIIVPSLTGAISDATGSKVYSFYLAVVIMAIGTFIFYMTNLRKKKVA